jgi:hypothetical protein
VINNLMVGLGILVCGVILSCNNIGSNNPSEKCDLDSFDADSVNFSIKKYVVDKYHPGDCFGMPSPPVIQAMANAIKADTVAANKISNVYGITDTFELYTKLRMFQAVTIKTADCKIDVNFADGQCCSINRYSGQIYVVKNQITDSISLDSTDHVPCKVGK